MDRSKEYLEHVRKLLRDGRCPELSEELAEEPLLKQIHDELKAIREITTAFSAGDFSLPITVRGIIPGGLKALQAHLRHLIWQVQMIEKGDFTQKVVFMGEFSTAFNNMVLRLSRSLAELQDKEKTLKDSEARFKFLASHDPLTGILSRRSFIELAGVELVHAAHRSTPCCVAMMDLDYFKDFNENHGHLAGDEALRHAVKILEAGLRRHDFMGRYGGEEFVFFFFGADEQTGMGVADRLRKNLSEKPVLLKGSHISITASFGIAGSTSENSKEKDYVQKLINNADSALYLAKKAGRNTVIMYKSEETAPLSKTLEPNTGDTSQ